ncbi:hypothetical protein [Streptomyces sp. NPDC002566]
MTPRSQKTWREKITVAAITGFMVGAARAVVGKILEHLTSS